MPSWSWASCPQGVEYETSPRDEEEEYFEFKFRAATILEEARCVAIGSNPFGTVSSGLLRLREPLFDFSFSYIDLKTCSIDVSRVRGAAEARAHDWTLEPDAPLIKFQSVLFDGYSVRRALPEDPISEPFNDVPIHFLYLGWYRREPMEHHLIILGRSPVQKDTFVRVGFSNVNGEYFDKWLKSEKVRPMQTISLV